MWDDDQHEGQSEGHEGKSQNIFWSQYVLIAQHPLIVMIMMMVIMMILAVAVVMVVTMATRNERKFESYLEVHGLRTVRFYSKVMCACFEEFCKIVERQFVHPGRDE